MAHQGKLTEEKDEFVESLNLTPEKISEDFEIMDSIEGSPIGDKEDILEISDPPYYTAYPNPYINDFIEMYGTPYDEETDDYNVEPFLEDESYGRTDSVYNIHFYHTKVPPQAIKTYIEHYTNKGDIVLDFFAGSGMTAVAASRLGRFPILIDLSPFSTFISYNNIQNINLEKFKDFAYSVYNSIYNEYAHLYSVNGNNEIQRNFTVWSEVQNCPFCNNDYLFAECKGQKRTINCPNCQAELKISQLKCKKDVEGKGIFKPVEIHYINKRKRETIPVTGEEIQIIENLEKLEIPYWVPKIEIPTGYNTSQPLKSHGFNEVTDFFTKRNLLILSAFFNEIRNYNIDDRYKKRLIYCITAAMARLTILNRYMPSHNRHVGPLSGTLYVPKLFAEINPFKNIKEKIDAVLKAIYDYQIEKFIISTQSATDLSNLKSNSVDYIFIDPPFGENLMYSELNFIWESWFKVFSNNEKEAIINSFQNKDEYDYFQLMYKCLKESNRVLKPNRWITLEFHNSKASIWRIIQESLVRAGFIVAQVLTLDKQKGTTKQLSYAGTVKNDLIINAYKPVKSFSEKFLKQSGLNMEKSFIKMHLNKLPIQDNVERTSQMLYSKLLAQYIQNDFEVRMDATEFYEFLKNNFDERDGYWFNKDQVTRYEKSRYKQKHVIDHGQTLLGISDEKSTINWLLKFLENPKTYNEIYTEFTKILLTSEDKIPELKTILSENFATENDKYRLPSEIERQEIQDIREKRLLKEFNEIFEEAQSKRKIKEVRKEALLHGLMNLYKKKDVEKIKLIGDKVDRNIIDSDDDISAIIDWAMYN